MVKAMTKSRKYEKAMEQDLVLPTHQSEASDEKYERATVIDPIKGYYDVPTHCHIGYLI